MKEKKKASNLSQQECELGLGELITRRDFVGGVLVGSGTALLGGHPTPPLGSSAPQRSEGPLGPGWTGSGGVGDYSRSNGNTHRVVNAAHSIRDGLFDEAAVVETGEVYDVIVVGGGFSGFGAAYTCSQELPSTGRCLLLDNHPIFGGAAKQNEFEVDGYRLYGPQASNSVIVGEGGRFLPDIWKELGLPLEFEFQGLTGSDKDIRVAADSFGPMMKWPERTSVGYFYQEEANAGRWVMDAQKNRFRESPITDSLRRDLVAAIENRVRPNAPASGWEQWLDSMTYQQFLTRELKLSPDVLYRYVDPYLACGAFGISGDAASAYGAFRFQMPGTGVFIPEAEQQTYQDRRFIGFPGGNTAILRKLLKRMVPDAIRGSERLLDVALGSVNFEALDRAENRVRVRLGATVGAVRHVATSGGQDQVTVDYSIDGRVYRARAAAVVMSIGGWMARNVLRDMPEDLGKAYREFHHGPVMSVNVALRNWRFMENLGISAVRWFDGLGWFANIRRPMILDGRSQPLDPNLPAVLTLYIPFLNPGEAIDVQITLSQLELLSTSYRDFETRIREQLVRLFGRHGFDPKRDIAGIVLNRWGHAYVAPQPGFYFGKDGQPAPRDIVRQGYGQIRFGHGELTGLQSWYNGYLQGRDAARQCLELLA